MHLDSLPVSSEDSADLWQEWHDNQLPQHSISLFIWTWMKELANQYCKTQNQPNSKKNGSYSVVVPWLPTAVTHRIMLEHLDQDFGIGMMLKYYMLLARKWPQYIQWALHQNGNNNNNQSETGFGSIKRLVYGKLVKQSTEMRESQGLRELPPPGSNDDPFNYQDQIPQLARDKHQQTTATTANQTLYRLVYNQSLHAFAQRGDLRTVLYHEL